MFTIKKFHVITWNALILLCNLLLPPSGSHKVRFSKIIHPGLVLC